MTAPRTPRPDRSRCCGRSDRPEAHPPRTPRLLLTICVHPADRDEVIGDLDELYAAYHASDGTARARAWYLGQVATSAPRFVLQSFHWRMTMLRNYLKLTFRTLGKQKIQGLINLSGLSLGIAACILILLFIRNELTYDQGFDGHSDVVQLNEWRADAAGVYDAGNTNLSLPLGEYLKTDVAGVESVVRTFSDRTYARRGTDVFEVQTMFADPSLLAVFPFDVRAGSRPSPTAETPGVVLSESAATRLFGDVSPVGSPLEVRVGDAYRTYDVAAVTQNPPENGTIQYEVVVPLGDWVRANFPQAFDAYGWSLVKTYARLRPDADLASIDAALKLHYDATDDGYLDRLRTRNSVPDDVQPATWRAMPLTQMHSLYGDGPGQSRTLAGLGLTILLIACINFMTLAIGRSLVRSREVGIRKAVGAVRGQIIGQFWGEAFTMTLLSTALGLALAWQLLPVFNGMTDRTLTFSLFGDWWIPAGILGVVILTGLVAGSYPAVVLSAFKPVDVLKNRTRASGSNLFTKGLVTLQFAVSVALIISTLIMHRQSEFVGERHRGFSTDHVVLVDLNEMDGAAARERFRLDLEGEAAVLDMTLASSALGYYGSKGMSVDIGGEKVDIDMLHVDDRFTDVMDIPVEEGRGFDASRASDLSGVIVNRALLEAFGRTDAVGEELRYHAEREPVTILGVTPDIIFQSLYQRPGPLMISLGTPETFNYLYVRLAPGPVDGVLDRMQASWTSMTTDVPFTFEFMDERMARVYADDARWANVINIASVCAIFLALLGLLGLTSLTVQNRTKEIGIRRVLGASRLRIVLMIVRDFALLIVVGAALAVPAAYVFADDWLANYAFRAEIGPGLYAAAILGVVGLAALTIASQSFRTVSMDPVDTLRAE